MPSPINPTVGVDEDFLIGPVIIVGELNTDIACNYRTSPENQD